MGRQQNQSQPIISASAPTSFDTFETTVCHRVLPFNILMMFDTDKCNANFSPQN